MKSPNFNVHIKKIDAWASKKFTITMKVLDNVIPSFWFLEKTFHSIILRVYFSMKNIYCISNSISNYNDLFFF